MKGIGIASMHVSSRIVIYVAFQVVALCIVLWFVQMLLATSFSTQYLGILLAQLLPPHIVEFHSIVHYCRWMLPAVQYEQLAAMV